MSEWKLWKFSKYNNPCCVCGKPLPKEAPRYGRKNDEGRYEDMCLACAVEKGITEGNNSQPHQSRDTAIAQAHAENMESARQTRNCLGMIIAELTALNKAMEKRNELLEAEAKR